MNVESIMTVQWLINKIKTTLPSRVLRIIDIHKQNYVLNKCVLFELAT